MSPLNAELAIGSSIVEVEVPVEVAVWEAIPWIDGTAQVVYDDVSDAVREEEWWPA